MLKRFRALLGIIIIVFVFLYIFKYSQAQSNSANDGVVSSDAIAVRIIPNPNHYDISRWYASQDFQGSPQILTVDGYEAIRDGRTVYVNATNVDENKNIYTNIYLISYNQNPTPNTIDILGQIVSHWNFNNNLTANYNQAAACSISSINCSSDSDCSSDQSCATSGKAVGTCLLNTTKNCISDSECPVNFYCDSVKSQIVRDVKRLGRLEELKIALANFKKINNHYPLLSSGTYLPNNSVSLWPSWSQVLLSNLTSSPSLVDPINHLGACPGYDKVTCWDQENKKFFSTPTNSTLILPNGSYALAYSSNSTGSTYNLCATLESRELNYHFTPNNPSASTCVTTTGIGAEGMATNTPPQLVDKFLIGEAGQEFNGFIKVIDVNNDPLTWLLTPDSSSSWSSWHSNASDIHAPLAPILKDTSNPNQKKVYADLAGNQGTYNMTLTVSDGRGGILSTTTPITILFSSINITAENGEYSLGSSEPFNYSFSFSGDGLNTPSYSEAVTPNSYFITKIDGPFDLLASTNKTITSLNSHSYQIVYAVNKIPQNAQLSKTVNFYYRIRVTDKNSHSVTKDFSLKINPASAGDSPSFSANCPTEVRFKQNYLCQFNPNNQFTYSASGLPDGLIIDNFGITGTSTLTGTFPVNITASNNYGLSTDSLFNLKVNTYCGDNVKQTPNTEGAGGPSNDGNELCDGNDGLAASVILSSDHSQYACKTGVDTITPYPIITNDQCVFKSKIDGGGWCGDGYCQALNNDNQVLETCGNCSTDCGVCPLPPVTVHGKVVSYANYAYPSVPLSNVNIVITGPGGSPVITATTNSLGEYSVNIPIASSVYKAIASLAGYSDTIQNFTPNVSQNLDFMMSSPAYSGLNKIKLDWGAKPKDLDSHLLFGSDHVYYLNKDVASSSLDIDDRDGYGPENIRIKEYVATNYQYYVYNYSRCGSFKQNESLGVAKVTVYNSQNGVLKTYTADSSQGAQTSCYWHVFDLNNQGNITDVNSYSNTGPF